MGGEVSYLCDLALKQKAKDKGFALYSVSLLVKTNNDKSCWSLWDALLKGWYMLLAPNDNSMSTHCPSL